MIKGFVIECLSRIDRLEALIEAETAKESDFIMELIRLQLEELDKCSKAIDRLKVVKGIKLKGK